MAVDWVKILNVTHLSPVRFVVTNDSAELVWFEIYSIGTKGLYSPLWSTIFSSKYELTFALRFFK